MQKALVMLSALALLSGCAKPADDAGKKKPAPMKGETGRPGPIMAAPVFRAPGTPAGKSDCDDEKHRLWASCQAAILLKYQDKPSFRVQFPACRTKAVKAGADGTQVVSGAFTTWNTGYKRGFRCVLKKSKGGYDIVSREVTAPGKASMRPPAAKAPAPKAPAPKAPAPRQPAKKK